MTYTQRPDGEVKIVIKSIGLNKLNIIPLGSGRIYIRQKIQGFHVHYGKIIPEM